MNVEEQLTLSACWDNELVPAGEISHRNLLIKLVAPARQNTEDKRLPINLALVIDRSGSMNGEPIAAACQAAAGIVDCLDNHDRLSLVIFNDEVDTLFSGLLMHSNGKAEAREKISGIFARGTTDLAAGWFEGARCVSEVVDNSDFEAGNVLVLSDGYANRGLCSPDELQRHSQELAAREIKTSAIGIGAGYSPLQLDALTEGGRGRLHDAETTADIIDVVAGELGELNAIVARDIELTLNYPTIGKLEPLTRMAFEESSGKYLFKVGDLSAMATRSIALRVDLPRLEQGEHLPFQISVVWRGARDDDSSTTLDKITHLIVVPADEANSQQENLDVIEQIADLWEASLAYTAVQLNEVGDYAKASLIYDEQIATFADLVNELPDRSARAKRLAVARNRVAEKWDGRSKRLAYALSKKSMRSEPDLRKRAVGNFKDQLTRDNNG